MSTFLLHVLHDLHDLHDLLLQVLLSRPAKWGEGPRKVREILSFSQIPSA